MADKLSHIHDDLLGYMPRAGHREPGITIDADGLRISGMVAQTSSIAPILAVGNSFTFGLDVADTETWPAQLQLISGRRVLNGGVSGYGFDQIVLRAEQLTAIHKPSVVVVGFIADDILRTEMRRMWWHDKPWFAIENGRLVLKGVPVPNREVLPLRVRRRVERLVIELPPFLQYLLGYHRRVHPTGAGRAIACRLTERLAALQAESRARVIMLAQYEAHVWIKRGFGNERRGLAQTLLDCAASNGLATLDSFHRLAAEPEPRAFYAPQHMNAHGNLMIARLLAAALPALLDGAD